MVCYANFGKSRVSSANADSRVDPTLMRFGTAKVYISLPDYKQVLTAAEYMDMETSSVLKTSSEIKKSGFSA